MSERNPELLIADIKEAMEKAERYVDNLSFDEFLADEKTIDAVVRNFEIIGEAASRLPVSFKHDQSIDTLEGPDRFSQCIDPRILWCGFEIGLANY